nr:histidine kinase N-terminal 7TM domain-containing protein [Cohnella thailandensis]
MESNTVNSQLTIYLTLISLSGIFNVFLGLYVFPRRSRVPSSSLLILYSLALAVYSFGYAFELNSTSTGEVKLWNTLEYVGLSFSIPIGLLVILQYLGRKPARAYRNLLFVIPIATWVLVATNDLHHFFYKEFALLEGSGGAPRLTIGVGEGYIVFSSYAFCCWLAGLMLLMNRWKQTRKTYRPQLLALILGQIAPMVAGFVYLFGIIPPLDPIPLGLTGSSGLYVWAVLANKRLTVVPIAKETIFDSTEVGFLVLDSTNRLIDYNRTAGRLLPSIDPYMIGWGIHRLWVELTGKSLSHPDLPKGKLEELNLTAAGGSRLYYEVRCSVLRHRDGEEAGRLLSLINVTEMKRLQMELEHQAYHDGLTQIYNRAHFVQLARDLLEQSLRAGRSFTVVLFDIDFFKRVNDTYGHDMGDKVIRHVVSVCGGRLEEDMLFARYGGEEFVLALPSRDLAEGCRFAESLRDALEHAPLVTQQGTVALTSSFGVAETKGSGETLDVLLGRADEALYESKRNGRNRVSA